MLINFEQIVILILSNIGLTNLPYFWPFFAIIKETAHIYDQNLMLISILSNNYISVEALRRLCLALFPVIPALIGYICIYLTRSRPTVVSRKVLTHFLWTFLQDIPQDNSLDTHPIIN